MLPVPAMVRLPSSSRDHSRSSPHVPDVAASAMSDAGANARATKSEAIMIIKIAFFPSVW